MSIPAPDLHIPESQNTVQVSIINTTATIKGVHAWKFLQPPVKGHEWLAVPCFSILIHHPGLDRTLVFDLGIRKDWWNLAPHLTQRFRDGGYDIRVDKGVREILDDHGVDTARIEAVAWSHWHFDHTGDPSTFDAGTALLVGPGFAGAMLPGYPADAAASVLEADFAGRELRELSFDAQAQGALKIGGFAALDYFGDGSFYFLDAPGHAVGHICGLARVGSGDSFVFLGGDAAHHGGEIRPSPYMPLPEEIVPHPFTDEAAVPFCPGAIFDGVGVGAGKDDANNNGTRSEPFYAPSTLFGIQHDAEEAGRTIRKLQEVDVRDDVLVVLAHDESLLDVVDFFPKRVDDFARKDWVRKCRWRFLKDFAGVVGWEGAVAGKRDWSGRARA